MTVRDDIRDWVLVQGHSQRSAAHRFAVSRDTVARMLREAPEEPERRYRVSRRHRQRQACYRRRCLDGPGDTRGGALCCLRCPCWQGGLHTHIYQVVVVVEPDVLHRLGLGFACRRVVGKHCIADRQTADGALAAGGGDRCAGREGDAHAAISASLRSPPTPRRCRRRPPGTS